MGRAHIYDNRGVCATVFLDADVHARLKRDARERGLSLSCFVNSLGLAYIKANPAAPVVEEAPVPAPRRRTQADAPPPSKRRTTARPTRKAARGA